MAKIYDAQIQWQSPSGHRFQAQPLEDYISAGLAEVSKAAGQASEGIQRLHDIDATERMKQAGVEAANYIDNFEDFSGDNYMEKMQATAMQFWDDAYSQLDEPTKRRFEMNNPKARDIFEFTVSKSAVDKTFSHQATQYKRLVPTMASQIVALGNPNEIKKALFEKINELYASSDMRADDAEQVVDSLRLAVAQGAVSQAMGEGRLEDAAALNNDLDFSSAFTPEKRAQNNVSIQNLLNAKKEAKKELTQEKKREAVVKTAVAGGESLYNYLYASAGKNKDERKRVTELFNKFLNDFVLGDIDDEYGGVPLTKAFPDLSFYADMPYTVRQEVATKIRNMTLEGNPIDRENKAILGGRIATLGARFPVNDDNEVDLKSAKPETMAEVFDVLDQISSYYSFSKGVQEEIDKLVQVRTAYTDRASAALKHSAYQDQNTLINQKTGLGWETQKYMQSGNLAPDTMDALRKGIAKTQGIVFNEQYRDAMVDAMQNFAYWVNGGEMPVPGSYEELAMMEAVTLQNMSLEDKKALGIEYVTSEDIVHAWLRRVNEFDALGVLKTDVPDEIETDALGQVVKYVPGAQSLLGSVAPQTLYQNSKARGKPIKDTPWYQSMLSTIMYLNNAAQPDTSVLESYASANRSTQYKYGADRVKYAKVSSKARPATEDSRAYKNPENAGLVRVKF